MDTGADTCAWRHVMHVLFQWILFIGYLALLTGVFGTVGVP